MKNIKSHFMFSNKQSRGIFLLVLCIVVIQSILIWTPNHNVLHSKLDVTAERYQNEIDSLHDIQETDKHQLKSFIPNFISDYKGYKLGLSTAEINRLHTFRKQNKYVNSSLEFQKVTKISDSLLNTISPFFKFPEWVKKRKKGVESSLSKMHIKRLDINSVTLNQLKSRINLNYKILNRILNFRNALGGFLKIEQLKDVYGLSIADYELLKQNFTVKTIPNIKKININLASESEISNLVYISNSLSKEIVEERTLRGGFKTMNDLKYVKGFPVDKLKHIVLYIKLK